MFISLCFETFYFNSDCGGTSGYSNIRFLICPQGGLEAKTEIEIAQIICYFDRNNIGISSRGHISSIKEMIQRGKLFSLPNVPVRMISSMALKRARFAIQAWNHR